jgi:hypothetical protein
MRRRRFRIFEEFNQNSRPAQVRRPPSFVAGSLSFVLPWPREQADDTRSGIGLGLAIFFI